MDDHLVAILERLQVDEDARGVVRVPDMPRQHRVAIPGRVSCTVQPSGVGPQPGHIPAIRRLWHTHNGRVQAQHGDRQTHILCRVGHVRRPGRQAANYSLRETGSRQGSGGASYHGKVHRGIAGPVVEFQPGHTPDRSRATDKHAVIAYRQRSRQVQRGREITGIVADATYGGLGIVADQPTRAGLRVEFGVGALLDQQVVGSVVGCFCRAIVQGIFAECNRDGGWIDQGSIGCRHGRNHGQDGSTGFKGADITACTLRTGYAALVSCRARGGIACVDGRTAGQQGHGLGQAAIIRQRAKQGIVPDDIAVDAVRQPTGSGGVFDQIVYDRANCSATVNAIPAGWAIGNDRILEIQRAEHVDHTAAAVGGSVSRDGTVDERARGAVVEHAAASPANRVPRESAVRDRQRAKTGVNAATRVGFVPGEGAICDRQRSLIIVNTTAIGGIGRVPRESAVRDGQRAAVVVNAAAVAASIPILYGQAVEGQVATSGHSQDAVRSGSTAARQCHRVAGGGLNNGLRRAVAIDGHPGRYIRKLAAQRDGVVGREGNRIGARMSIGSVDGFAEGAVLVANACAKQVAKSVIGIGSSIDDKVRPGLGVQMVQHAVVCAGGCQVVIQGSILRRPCGNCGCNGFAVCHAGNIHREIHIITAVGNRDTRRGRHPGDIHIGFIEPAHRLAKDHVKDYRAGVGRVGLATALVDGDGWRSRVNACNGIGQTVGGVAERIHRLVADFCAIVGFAGEGLAGIGDEGERAVAGCAGGIAHAQGAVRGAGSDGLAGGRAGIRFGDGDDRRSRVDAGDGVGQAVGRIPGCIHRLVADFCAIVGFAGEGLAGVGDEGERAVAGCAGGVAHAQGAVRGAGGDGLAGGRTGIRLGDGNDRRSRVDAGDGVGQAVGRIPDSIHRLVADFCAIVGFAGEGLAGVGDEGERAVAGCAGGVAHAQCSVRGAGGDGLAGGRTGVWLGDGNDRRSRVNAGDGIRKTVGNIPCCIHRLVADFGAVVGFAGEGLAGVGDEGERAVAGCPGGVAHAQRSVRCAGGDGFAHGWVGVWLGDGDDRRSGVNAGDGIGQAVGSIPGCIHRLVADFCAIVGFAGEGLAGVGDEGERAVAGCAGGIAHAQGAVRGAGGDGLAGGRTGIRLSDGDDRRSRVNAGDGVGQAVGRIADSIHRLVADFCAIVGFAGEGLAGVGDEGERAVAGCAGGVAHAQRSVRGAGGDGFAHGRAGVWLGDGDDRGDSVHRHIDGGTAIHSGNIPRSIFGPRVE